MTMCKEKSLLKKIYKYPKLFQKIFSFSFEILQKYYTCMTLFGINKLKHTLTGRYIEGPCSIGTEDSR